MVIPNDAPVRGFVEAAASERLPWCAPGSHRASHAW